MRSWATATATVLLAAAACKRTGGAPAKPPPPAPHAHGSPPATGEPAAAPEATVTIDMANAPPGLVVLIDGAEARIPATVVRTPGHTHRVKATAPGYEPLVQEIPDRGPDYVLLELREAR